MHETTRDGMIYWLEFKNDDEFPSIFGSIAGGSALKYGFYRRQETGRVDDRTAEVTADDHDPGCCLVGPAVIGISSWPLPNSLRLSPKTVPLRPTGRYSRSWRGLRRTSRTPRGDTSTWR